MTESEDEVQIACTLNAGDFQARLKTIAALNAASLRGVERDGLRLTLTYARDAFRQVEQMVSRERECCAFLTFDVRETPDGVQVTITAPAAARDAAAAVFDQFCAKTLTPINTGRCCGTGNP